MSLKAKASAVKDEVENKEPKKAAPSPKQAKSAKKPIESIGLKAMRAVNLNDDDKQDAAKVPAPKQSKKIMSPLASLHEAPAAARAVEMTNGRISLDSALNNIADQRRIQAQSVVTPQLVEKPILKELAGLLRK